jgi:hypothetical protein
MRQQSYGDKQREEQQRKKQEELWEKTHPKSSHDEEPKPDVDTDDAVKKTGDSDKPARKTA